MLTAIIFILVLGIIVIVHEFGHFIAAKKNGVLVEEFGWGYPPRVFGIKFGETLYSINLLPLGGFVKVYAEEYHEADESIKPAMKERAFIFKKPWQKAVILLGGIFMNVIFAVIIFYILLAANSFRSEPFTIFNDYKFPVGTQEERVVVAHTVDDSPAAKAGINAGDLVKRISTDKQNWISVFTADQLIEHIKAAEGKNLSIEFVNVGDNTSKVVTLIPRYNEKAKRVLIGVGLGETITLVYDTPLEKIASGFLHSYNITSYSIATMGYFIGSSLKEKSFEPVSETVAGPVGIFRVIGTIVDLSGGKLLVNMANFTALLSLSLAIMNVLPFPALDGGRMVFVIYEWIARRRPNHKVEQYVNFIGFATLLLLAVVITINDIIKITQ